MQQSIELYPLKFEPILKPVIWGGSDICKFKNIQPLQDGIGESWEVSDVKGQVSVVANGPLAGKLLSEILSEEKGRLVGEHNYARFGNTFPLLIKFIDARDDLSIQVHPDDTLARKRHNSFGKTEMWYIIKARPEASLYSGFAESITPNQYVEKVKDNTFTSTLKKYSVKAGDVFFLPAGRVHAIGAGCFIAEIQQTSDITYRIYDYNRKDAQGNGRELHTELAKDAIDFKVYDSYKTDYAANPNNPVELVSCPYFTTTLLDFNEKQERNLAGIDSFVIYICMEGSCSLSDDKGYSLSLSRGETALVPATAKSVSFAPQQQTKLLETCVK
ncbi:MAG: class I mannose-6-phosphate isomerase [Dysgonamonadaceae bacterium]|jgi:mannose-6-phosphate isomerase|nr:class I mannose-6-phosphate isomerase [Dysgonamonadaceae bacterium]